MIVAPPRIHGHSARLGINRRARMIVIARNHNDRPRAGQFEPRVLPDFLRARHPPHVRIKVTTQPIAEFILGVGMPNPRDAARVETERGGLLFDTQCPFGK